MQWGSRGNARATADVPPLAPPRGVLVGRRRWVLCAALVMSLLGSLLGVALAPVQAAPAWAVSPDAPCGALAGLSPTATNGPGWGRTVLAGHNAPGGWFGVDVCSNGMAQGGANVSCDRVPADVGRTGCAPGGATSDGFGWTFQCVELVVRFAAWAWGTAPNTWGRGGWGNAPDLWLPQNHPAEFVMYPNGSAQPPVPGDILVWGEVDGAGNPLPAGPRGEHGGHIGIVAAVRDGKIITAEQNVKWGAEDHPSDTLALAHVGDRWIVSGSAQPETRLPTYRWRSTMGTSRATYGWLHSTRNNGTFPARQSTSAAAKSTPAVAAPSKQAPGGLPSLAPATVITGSGTLADLTWSAQTLFGTAATDAPPRAQARSLGTPPHARLALDQTPASLLLPGGVRETYALGTDGHLYRARTEPRVLGVSWTDLGQPEGVRLVRAPTAARYAGGLLLSALGSDGALWWRAGPLEQPGGWVSAGAPSGTQIGTFTALIGAPGAGTPLLLALGTDGALYQRVWHDALLNSSGGELVSAGWSDWLRVAGPTLPRLGQSAVLLLEPGDGRNTVGGWPDAPAHVFVLDAAGALWHLRLETLTRGWTAQRLTTAAPLTDLLAATVTPAAPTTPSTGAPGAEMHLYARAGSAATLGTLPLVAPVGKPAPQPHWTALPPLPEGTLSRATALPLAPATSGLVLAQADDVVLGGSAEAVAIVAPAAAAPTASATPGATAPSWALAGTVVPGLSFGDALLTPTVDTRWRLRGAEARTTASAAGLRLAAGSQGVAALLQGGLPGDAGVQVHVALPQGTPQGTQTGLVLAQDDGSWLTLLVDGAGTAQYCGAAWGAQPTCARLSVAGATSVDLRITRAGQGFAGALRVEGSTWRTVGQWAPVPRPAAQPAQTATPRATPTTSPTPHATQLVAPAVASLPFTEWGLLVRGAPGATGQFTGYALTAGAQR